MGEENLKSTPIKVVIDTNVLISAFLWQKQVKEIFNLAKENKIQICVSIEILDEFQKVLNYPKFSDKLESIQKTSEKIIDEFLEIAKLYHSEKLSFKIIKKDPSDDKFLVCAVNAEACFIISGDKHLLEIKKYRGIPIISVKNFLEIISLL